MKKNQTKYDILIDMNNSGQPDTGLVIQHELDLFLSQKRLEKNKLFTSITLLVISMAFLVGLVVMAPRIGRWFVRQWQYTQTVKYVKTIQKNRILIKETVLEQMPINYFDDYQMPDVREWSEKKLAALIHQFSTDFYAKPHNIRNYDERRVFAFSELTGFDLNNFYNLERTLLDDSTWTLREWLLSKLNNRESDYYNPRYGELVQTIQVYMDEYQKELNRPFDKTVVRKLRWQLVEKPISGKNPELIVINSIEFLNRNSTALARENYYRQKIKDLSLELDIRLALFHAVLARDYGIKGNMASFGWMAGDMKGARLIKESAVPQIYIQFQKKLKEDVENFYKFNESARKIFENLAFDELQLVICNPLRIGLIVKDVGLFAVARKNEKGSRYEHKGIDLIAEEGTPVFPVQDGFVSYVGNDGSGHGNHIEIWHDGNIRSVYSHLKDDKTWQNTFRKFNQEGPYLTTVDERIASVGTSGNIPEGDAQYGYAHLHLEIREGGQPLNPFMFFNENIRVIH